MALRVSTITDLLGNLLAPKCINYAKVVTVGAAGNYPTLRAAVDAYRDYFVTPNGSLTFSLAAEVIPDTTLTVIENPSFARARIVGADPIDISLTSVASTAGSAGVWDQVLNVSSTAGLFVGAYVLARVLTGGTNPYRLAGCHKITAIGSGTITVRNRNRHTSVASGAVTGTLRVLRSVVSVPAGQSGIHLYSELGGYGGSGLHNVVIASAGSGGIGVLVVGRLIGHGYEGGSAFNLGVDGFDWGVHTAAGGVTHLGISSASLVCLSGANAGCLSVHRTGFALSAHCFVASGGVTYGVNADTGSTVDVHGDTASTGAVLTGNATNCFAYANSHIRRYNIMNDDAVTTSASPTVNTIGNANSLVEA